MPIAGLAVHFVPIARLSFFTGYFLPDIQTGNSVDE